jgi:hypothetical protein
LKSGAKLSDAYQGRSLPVARQQLYQSGVRMAMVFNEAFAEE